MVLRWFTFICLVSAAALAEGGHQHGAGPRHGRYYGSVSFPSLGVRYPAALELTEMDFGEYSRLVGFLRLMPGGPDSGEYLTYYYGEILPSQEGKRLTFADGDADLRIRYLTTTSDRLDGEVTSALGKSSGEIHLQMVVANDEEPDIDEPGDDEPIIASFGAPSGPGPELAWAGALSGELSGRCGRREASLQIETARGLADEVGMGFDYALAGRLSLKDRCSVVDDGEGLCWVRGYAGGSYRPFLEGGALQMNGPRGAIRCRVTATAMECRERETECRFTRPLPKVSSDTIFRRLAHIARTKEEKAPLPDTVTPEALKGRFKGFVHFESSDRYTPAELTVDSFNHAIFSHQGEESLEVVGELAVAIGASDQIQFRFEHRQFSRTFGTFTFTGPGDGMLRVLSWESGFIRGVLYAKSYGRVGTVELVRDRAPEPKGMKMLPGLSGGYQGPRWQFELRTSPRVSRMTATAIGFEGNSWFSVAGGSLGPEIRRGSFDPYTLRVALELEGGSLVTGLLVDRGLELLWPLDPKLTSVVPNLPWRRELYERKEER